MTTEQLRERIQQAAASIREGNPNAASMCIALHNDLGLERTPISDEERERISEATGELIDADAIDATEEHRFLHMALEGIVASAVMQGQVGSNLTALLVDIGFKLGLMAAADATSVTDLEDWLKEQ